MKKIFLSLVFLAISTLSHTYFDFNPDTTILNTTIECGTIQFPKTFAEIPPIRIYYGGNKIREEIDPVTKKITYTLPSEKGLETFYLLITEQITPVVEQDYPHIIKFLKVEKNIPYKFYRLTRSIVDTENKKDTSFVWHISQETVAENKKIPDYTIIVSCNPNYIDRIEAATNLELPRIYIKENILQEKFHDDSIEQIMQSIAFDTLHAPINYMLQNPNKKTVLAFILPQ